MIIRLSIASPRRQHGAALVVGLILMLVLTVLGVSGMTLAVSGLTMASNAQSQQNAFQAAETGIDLAIELNDPNISAPVMVPDTSLGDGTYRVTATQTYQGETLVPPGYGAASLGTFEALHFDVVSTGTGPDNARSIHNQSFFRVVLANED